MDPLRQAVFHVGFWLNCVFFAAHVAGADTDANASVTGRWQNADATLEVFAENGKLGARIVALREPTAPDGQAKTDIHNPDPSKHGQPIIGLVFMSGFTPTEPGKWENGTIYDPKSGKTYSCVIERQGTDKLKVRGYVGVSLIGRTEVWTRVQGD
ncbi:MAG TPA: DUF2147 domain-containing protein [Chthoniobacterales bacterium]